MYEESKRKRWLQPNLNEASALEQIKFGASDHMLFTIVTIFDYAFKMTTDANFTDYAKISIMRIWCI